MTITIRNKPEITIYTDGACMGNPGPGGWGAVLIWKGQEKNIFGSNPNTTNNQMELQAVISALNILKKPCDITLYTDSIYVKSGITEWIDTWQKNNWRTKSKKAVKNIELWKMLLDASKRHNIDWRWVKGHSNNKYNDIADKLAVKAKNIAAKA